MSKIDQVTREIKKAINEYNMNLDLYGTHSFELAACKIKLNTMVDTLQFASIIDDYDMTYNPINDRIIDVVNLYMGKYIVKIYESEVKYECKN